MRCRNAAKLIKGFKRNKMQTFISLQRQHYCSAKQAGVMPTVWFAINSLSGNGNDRTPEITVGSREGWDG